MQYHFKTEKNGALWFAYIWREEDDTRMVPPLKEFHSQSDNDESVSRQAARWIAAHGVRAGAIRHSQD